MNIPMKDDKYHKNRSGTKTSHSKMLNDKNIERVNQNSGMFAICSAVTDEISSVKFGDEFIFFIAPSSYELDISLKFLINFMISASTCVSASEHDDDSIVNKVKQMNTGQ